MYQSNDQSIISLQSKKSCFQCGNQCLELHKVCDGVIDCIFTQDDEKFCQTSELWKIINLSVYLLKI